MAHISAHTHIAEQVAYWHTCPICFVSGVVVGCGGGVWWWEPPSLGTQYAHTTEINESWHTYEWVMAHMWLSHITHMNTCEWVTSLHIVIWLIHMCAMTHSHVCHDSLTSVVCAPGITILQTNMNESYHNMKWCDSFICVHMCDMTQSHVCHDSLHNSHMCAMTPFKRIAWVKIPAKL